MPSELIPVRAARHPCHVRPTRSTHPDYEGLKRMAAWFVQVIPQLTSDELEASKRRFVQAFHSCEYPDTAFGRINAAGGAPSLLRVVLQACMERELQLALAARRPVAGWMA